MTKIKHHLTDALLMGYSAGTLPEAFNLVVATHVSLCDECRARMHEFDAIGGAVMEMSGEAEMEAGSLDAVLATINRVSVEKPSRPQPRSGLFPAPLRDFIGSDVDAVRWGWIVGGVSQAILPTNGKASLRLLRIPRGVAVPDHGHRGTELTLVLQGAFRDETDRFGPGDIEIANEAMVHKPVAEDGPDCICLAATDAPLRFSGLIPRVAQSILRI